MDPQDENKQLRTEWGIWCAGGPEEAFVCQVPAQDHADASDMVLESWLAGEWETPPAGKHIAIITAAYRQADYAEGGTGPAGYELTFIRWKTAEQTGDPQ